jgi:hypothetical protein
MQKKEEHVERMRIQKNTLKYQSNKKSWKVSLRWIHFFSIVLTLKKMMMTKEIMGQCP